jgi:hypothetical protein
MLSLPLLLSYIKSDAQRSGLKPLINRFLWQQPCCQHGDAQNVNGFSDILVSGLNLAGSWFL